MSSRLVAGAMSLVALVTVWPPASAQAGGGADVIIRLRLVGDSATLPSIRSCLVDRLSQMPDVKVAIAPTAGARFIVDIVASKEPGEIFLRGLWWRRRFRLRNFDLGSRRARTPMRY